MAVGGPAKGVDEIAESLSATRVFLPFQESAALAASVLDPDVIMFERVVNFCFHSAIDGIGDASVRRVSEGGDVLVDGLERFVEILGLSGRQGTAADDGTYERTEMPEPAKSACGTGTGHCLEPGCGPVYSEQQGFCVGVNSMNSTRVSSGS